MASTQNTSRGTSFLGDAGKRLTACLLCGLLAASLWWIPGVQDFLQGGMRAFQDHQAGGDVRLKPREDFVFLGIDAASLKVDGVEPGVVEANSALKMMKSRWPWDRRVHAEVIERLASAGARLIVLDLVFVQPSTPEGDQAMSRVIDKYRDRIVLASEFVPQAEGTQVMEPLELFLGPLDDETPVGFVNYWPHVEDRMVKRPKLSMTLNEANGMDSHPDEPDFYSLAAVSARCLGVDLPEDEKRFRMQRIRGENVDAVYSAESLYTIFVPHDWVTKYDNGEYFRDKVVLIGPAAPHFQDSHETPAGRLLGAQLHLHVLGAILEDAWYEEAALGGGASYFFLLTALALIGSSLITLRWGQTLVLGTAAVGGVLVWYVLEMCAVKFDDRLLGSMVFPTTYVTGVLGAIIWQAMVERARRQQLHRHLQRSMSPDVADAIAQAPEGYYAAASGNRREVTVLFTDVRGFTSRSEQQDADELVSQLNEYLGRMVEVIFMHGGTVDKFIGDAIMATWGGLDHGGPVNNNEKAVAAANDMLESLLRLNDDWKAQGIKPFKIGVGIHSGEAIVGEVGSDQRTDFTVIGDAVNLASRIEGMTKAVGVDLLVSSSVREGLPRSAEMFRVGIIGVKGRAQGVTLWSVRIGSKSDHDRFEVFLDLFLKGEFTRASKLLDDIEESNLSGIVQFYRNYLAQIAKNPKLADNWEGILRMETK